MFVPYPVRRSIIFALAITLSACGAAAEPTSVAEPTVTPTQTATGTPEPTSTPTPQSLNRLTIEWMRQQQYPGSEISIEKSLAAGSNYSQFIVSYTSDGLKIYALMTVPKGARPKTGWPVIVFNHGYIPPAIYRTTERYVAYVDAIAKGGYIVFKSDYRGHGNSQGDATGGYGSPGYTVDVLNALASLKSYKDADPNRIGMWGHSMGGQVTLRSLVIAKDIKAAVIWAGVVAPYADLLNSWHPQNGGGVFQPNPGSWRQSLTDEYGAPDENPPFWNSISPNAYVADISAPIQLHHSPADPHVPYHFSEILSQELKNANKNVEFYSYPKDDHNLSKSFNLAMQRTVAFFDKYVKAGR
jgi:uncharacterized protein